MNSTDLHFDFKGLPTPPAILIELIDACNRPDVSFVGLAKLIQKDAGVSSKVISVSNSPLYRQWNEIQDIRRLVVVLGLKTVKTIAITGAVQQFFAQVAAPVSRCVDEIWYYSLCCAYIAKDLAELTGYHLPEEAYLTGLLHRLGQLALLHKYPDEYTEIFEQKLTGEALGKLERDKLNITSCEIGASLIESWNIKSFISDAVRYQFEPTDEVQDGSHLVKLINLASHLSNAEKYPTIWVLDRADKLFGLNQSIIEDLKDRAVRKVRSVAVSFNIRLPSETGTAAANLDKEREAVHRALGDRVKGLALFGGNFDYSSQQNNFQQSLTYLQQDLGLLFGLQANCFLLHDDAANQLQAVSQDKTLTSLFKDISFSTKRDRSLAAKAFLNQSVVSSYDQETLQQSTIIDRQLSRVLGKPGVCYLPLSSPRGKLGLIAAGVTQQEWDGLQEQLNLLSLFAGEAANTLISQRMQEEIEQQRLAEERQAFHLEARKMVHEANNPLSIINNYLHILGMKLGEDSPVQGDLDIIREEIERVGNIILRIRDIPGELEKQSLSVDINKVIRDLTQIFQSSLFTTHKIETVLHLDERILPIVCNRGHLKQILTNLIKNAVEAMGDGGNLTITTHDKVYFNGKTYIELTVADNGPGIPDKIMDNIFSPVSSTKGGAHSGLGLAIVKNLVDELAGAVSCISNPEKGASIQLYLPRVFAKEAITE